MKNDLVHMKSELRASVIARRDAMATDRRAAASHDICERLEGFFDKEACAISGLNVAVYSPMNSEVDIAEFIEWLYAEGAQVAFPCMNKKGAVPHMHMRKVSAAAWRKTTVPFIARPIKRFAEDDPALDEFPIVAPESIDAIIVPMVAFDNSLQRLGYGGGNYDEYLGLLSRETGIVGVGFEEQRVAHVPIEPHDLPLPTIVSA